jgi:glycerol-3-phosphate dehydrogenase
MKYETYDQLISLVADFRLAHHNLTDDELDRLVKQTFRIDQATLRELDGVGDLLSVCYSERDRNF